MATLHAITGISLLAANGLAAAWGGYEWLENRPSAAWWYVLRVAQALVVIQAMLGFSLIVLGHVADDLHYLYGGLPLLVSLLAEMARAGAAQIELGETDFRALPEERQRAVAMAIVRREQGIMAAGSMVIFFLALRAAGTTDVIPGL